MQLTASYLSSLTGSLNQLTTNEQQFTSELSSGVRVNALSDDPVASGENVSLSATIEADDSYQQAAQTVTGRLQVTDSTLGAVVSQLTQAISSATEADTGTNNASNRASIATELTGIRDEVLSLANTSYMGSYLFSGSQSSVQPFSLDSSVDPAVVTYHGDSVQSTLTSPLSSSVALNTPGDQIFSASTANVFATLNQLISDVSSGNAASSAVDTTGLNSALALVSQQRVVLDNSITQITNQESTLQTQSTQLVTQQTNLMQANTATVATALSSSETQQTALQDAIAQLEKQGDLFSLLQ